jgi:cell filamentation protein
MGEMRMSDRYTADGIQGSFQPGSDCQVLANKLGITDPADMAEAELVLLSKLYEEVLIRNFPDRPLKVEDLKRWHSLWLGNVYEWAGMERSVNMSKDDFPFAAAGQVSRLLDIFQRECLDRYTPCHTFAGDRLASAMAITHVEFILIHPFREGNGRLSRLLADVMAVQSGHAPLDYSSWDADKPTYFAAIQQGVAGDYRTMTRLIDQAFGS